MKRYRCGIKFITDPVTKVESVIDMIFIRGNVFAPDRTYEAGSVEDDEGEFVKWVDIEKYLPKEDI